MQVAVIENNSVSKIADTHVLFPNVSFPSTGVEADFLQQNSLLEVVNYLDVDHSTYKLEEVLPYILDNKVYTVKAFLKSEEELISESENIKQTLGTSVRIQRNQLLKDSDWTQVADAPVDKTAWAAYRQELRDITGQEGFPFNVVFPTPPL